MKHLGMILICILFYNQLYAQNNTIPFHEATIKVDGKFDEPIWQSLPEITGFFNHYPIDTGLANNQTSVKVFHNGSHLFIRATYFDSIPKNQVSTLKRDVSIARSDAFIFAIDSQHQQQSGFLFAVNGKSTLVDALIERVNQGYRLNFSWNAVWNAKTSQEGTKKHYELAIPLKALNFNSNNTTFGIQFYVRDIKNNTWTTLTRIDQNYPTFDLRFTKTFTVEDLPNKSSSSFVVTPSMTYNYQDDISGNTHDSEFTPSLDLQYDLTSSLKLDATINPDFSQVEVDQQVTNLSRFALFFPERRNFFLENSDLFSNLGADGVNPFYSRRIGANSPIDFGLKLSGNISSKTRIGILNAQSSETDDTKAQNYATLVAEQQLSKNFTATGFFINRQETDNFNFKDDYNRVTGLNINYKSDNAKWTGLTNIAKSYNDELSGKNSFINTSLWYNKRGTSIGASVKNVGKNYITDVGFTPRLYNYNPITDLVERQGYTQVSAHTMLNKYYDETKKLNAFRYFNFNTDIFWSEDGQLTEINNFYNMALFLKNSSSMYLSFYHDYIDLQFGFSPLGNGQYLDTTTYNTLSGRIGYNSMTNKELSFRTYLHYGQYYNGTNREFSLTTTYRLDFANISGTYQINDLDLNSLGNDTFHLARFTSEIFFSNRLNWTTYVQYSTQRDNFNVNSRLQWEYKPLSYVYLVFTDNYNKHLERKNFGVSFKLNYRLDI